MVCIYCSSKLITTNSRHLNRTNGTWRRKECLKCKAIFTTNEFIDYELTLLVEKNQKLIPFNRDLLFISIFDSLKHRQNASIEASELTKTIINKLLTNLTREAININKIKEVSYQSLLNFDFVASVQYKAYFIDK